MLFIIDFCYNDGGTFAGLKDIVSKCPIQLASCYIQLYWKLREAGVLPGNAVSPMDSEVARRLEPLVSAVKESQTQDVSVVVKQQNVVIKKLDEQVKQGKEDVKVAHGLAKAANGNLSKALDNHGVSQKDGVRAVVQLIDFCTLYRTLFL